MRSMTAGNDAHRESLQINFRDQANKFAGETKMFGGVANKFGDETKMFDDQANKFRRVAKMFRDETN